MAIKQRDILDENTMRTRGVDALNSNIEAGVAVAQIVKTTLGPMGMDKMLIDSMGECVITNDGVKILREMDIEHPGAKMLVEVAKTQDAEVGDGTTTAVILSGELLSQAQELLKQKIHPTTIIRAYQMASREALNILEKNSKVVDVDDKRMLESICETAMTGKAAEGSKESLSRIVIEAVDLIKEDDKIDRNRIKIQKVAGGNMEESSLIRGIVLDKDFANLNMPRKIEDGKILLVDFPLEVKEPEGEAKLNINSLDEYEAFLKNEEDYLKSLVFKIKEIGANVIFCQKGIDDSVAYYLAKEGIIAVRRTRRSDIEKLSFAVGKKVVSSVEDISSDNLGSAKIVEKREVLGESYVFVEGCENPKAITIFLKSSTSHILDETERAIEDAIGDVASILRSKRIVAGGGALEFELYKGLENFSKIFSGKEQMIIKRFAMSFLSIPKVLCENSGFDEIETIAKIIAKHERGEVLAGINGFVGVVDDTIAGGIIEPINIKVQAIKSATEIASMILRIDDIIAAKRLKQEYAKSEEL